VSKRSPRILINALSAVALALLLVVLVPIWAGHRLLSEVRTRRRPGATTQIPRVHARDIVLDDVLRTKSPVIISGLVDELDLPLVPDLEGLRTLAAAHTEPFTVKSHRAHSPYFLYVGDYGAELASTDETTLAEFLDGMFDDAADRDPDTCTYRLFGVADLDHHVGRIIDSMAAGLSKLTDRRPEQKASGIWIGSTGVTTPLHHDAWTGLLFQMTGSKRVLMFAPEDRPNLYFTSPFAATDRWSTLPGRSDDADPATHPRYANAHRYEGRLDAGDVLFIPAFWSHEIEALEPNISIPFRFGTRPVDHLNPGFLRPAYEIVDRKLVAPRRTS
jgi:hypothetical protein